MLNVLSKFKPDNWFIFNIFNKISLTIPLGKNLISRFPFHSVWKYIYMSLDVVYNQHRHSTGMAFSSLILRQYSHLSTSKFTFGCDLLRDISSQWQIYIQKFPAHGSPRGPILFVFAYIFTEKHLRRRSMSPQWVHTANGSTPPIGNPGSAIGDQKVYFYFFKRPEHYNQEVL